MHDTSTIHVSSFGSEEDTTFIPCPHMTTPPRTNRVPFSTVSRSSAGAHDSPCPGFLTALYCHGPESTHEPACGPHFHEAVSPAYDRTNCSTTTQ